MGQGPFGGPRPFELGPLASSEEETNEDDDISWGEDIEVDKINENKDDVNIDKIEDKTVRAVLEMANEWYESITRDQSKHNMMKNYLSGVTELTDEEIEEILEKAGI